MKEKRMHVLLLEAAERMEQGIEPTAEDWRLYRRIYFSCFPFIISKKKKNVYNWLNEHLLEHKISDMNEEEFFTLRQIGRGRLEMDTRSRLWRAMLYTWLIFILMQVVIVLPCVVILRVISYFIH